MALLFLLGAAGPLFGQVGDFYIEGGQARVFEGDGGGQVVLVRGEVAVWQERQVVRGEEAVVWIERAGGEYQARVWAVGGAEAVGLEGVRAGRGLVAEFTTPGRVVLLAEESPEASGWGQELYEEAVGALSPGGERVGGPGEREVAEEVMEGAGLTEGGERVREADVVEGVAAGERPVVHVQPLGPARIESWVRPDGTGVATYVGGAYVYQQREEGLLELRAENAVVFYELPGEAEDEEKTEGRMPSARGETGGAMPSARGAVTGAYLEGDVILEGAGQRFEAERLYYDFVHRSAVVVDGTLELRLPDEAPLWVRADRIRQYEAQRWQGRGVVLSMDEFAQPQTWLGAERMELQSVNEEGELVEVGSAARYQYEMQDVTVGLGGVPVLVWPEVTGDSTTPRVPLQRIHTSHSSEWGAAFESEWSLASLLGLRRPPGLDEVMRLDYFSERGPGGGVEMEYRRERTFGSLRSYLVNDEGEDQLGRYDARDDVDPERELRGRATWQHRQYLPYDWQATLEVSYLSDPTFLESWEEKEFDTEKEQETLVYLKQQRDNWAFDFLNSWRLNDFEYEQTNQPQAGLYLMGQKLFETLTYSHEGFVTRLEERAGDREVAGPGGRREPWILPGSGLLQEEHALAVSRHTVGLPLQVGSFSVAPTVIGTYVYDDSRDEEEQFVQGAGGARAAWQLWHVDRAVRSRTWDIDGVRHIIQPEASAFWVDSDAEGQQADVFNFGLRQRWQTHRGAEGAKRRVDFLRLDASVTLADPDVEVEGDGPPGRYFFSHPEWQYEPSRLLNADFANLGLARREQWNQAVRDFVRGEWEWLISDRTALVGDMNYDISDGAISEASVTAAVQRTPRTAYYVGDKYVREADLFGDGEGGGALDSHFLTGGWTYRLNKKYTIGVAHQFDVRRGLDSYTQVVLMRKFVHWYGAFAFGLDPSKDSVSFAVSFWPEGYEDVAVGSRRFNRLAW